jgi:UDP-4-amino-4,6-dideoxy-N-acetyl-beta-L-altrosamine N-acetyltransferase
VGAHLTRADGGVRLRPLSADDGADIVRWRNEADVAGQMFSLPPASAEEHRRWFERMQARGDRQEFVIVAGERAVGTIGLSDIDRGHRRAQYGIVIGEADARGRGIARRASELILDHAFGDLRLNRVYLSVYADNAPALRLYRRLGFVEEGLLRQHAVRDGVARDVVMMGILRKEWEAAR